MKNIIIGAVGIAVIVMGVDFLLGWNNYDDVIVEAEKEEVIEVPTWQTDEEAIKAAQDVIQRKEWTKELEGLKAEDVLREAEMESLEKRLGLYWKSRQNVINHIRSTFPEEPNTAVAVAGWESGGYNPRAYNPEWHYRNGVKVCQGSYGIMQVACVHHIDNPEALFNVEFNLAVAHRIYADSKKRRGNGWLPWGAYTDGGYKNYLAMR